MCGVNFVYSFSLFLFFPFLRHDYQRFAALRRLPSSFAPRRCSSLCCVSLGIFSLLDL